MEEHGGTNDSGAEPSGPSPHGELEQVHEALADPPMSHEGTREDEKWDRQKRKAARCPEKLLWNRDQEVATRISEEKPQHPGQTESEGYRHAGEKAEKEQ
jgi:hypothetical protein